MLIVVNCSYGYDGDSYSQYHDGYCHYSWSLGLGQPFYYAQQRGWTKLTYGRFKLNDAIKVNNELVELPEQVHVEHTEPGRAMTVRNRLLEGVELRRSYSFVGDGMILKIQYAFTASQHISQLQARFT